MIKKGGDVVRTPNTYSFGLGYVIPAGLAGTRAPMIRLMSPTAAAMIIPILAKVNPDQVLVNKVSVVVL